MTIIKNCSFSRFYPFEALDANVRELMEGCFNLDLASSINRPMLKAFNAYCHLIDVKISYFTLSTPEFVEVAMGFIGALHNDCLLYYNTAGRVRMAGAFVDMINAVSEKIPILPSFDKIKTRTKDCYPIWERLKVRIKEKSIHYWNGWHVESTKGQKLYTAIPLIWHSHGEEFAEKIFNTYKPHIEKYARPDITVFNSFLTFLSKKKSDWPSSTFQNPIKIKQCFLDFMIDYFLSASQKGLDIATQTRLYAKFIFTMDQAFIQSGIWAKPFGGIPAPSTPASIGIETHVQKCESGDYIKTKLITHIPLEITDSEVIKLIFKQMKIDVDLVIKFSKKQSYSTRKAQLQRDQLAESGTAISYVAAARKLTTLREHDVCATLNQLGLKHIRERLTDRGSSLRIKRSDIAPQLALPGRNDLLPFKLLLIHSDPRITDSFLEDFQLYNKNYKLSGFLMGENGHYQLIGYKDRRGGDLSEQKIDLSPRQAVLIRQIIAITAPLRDELRAANDDKWRFLFLHSARALSYPAVNNVARWDRISPPNKEKLIDQLSQHTSRTREKITELISAVSLTSFRATCGVQIYLKTQSEREMAKALGHSTYNPGLLSRYLPEPILAFFQSRWVRIFQRGIICRAMKDSPMLLKAANFTSMDELHEFLSNHALGDIPKHLGSSDNTTDHKAPQEEFTSTKDSVLISVDIGTLTALISLRIAVQNSKHPDELNGLSLYWSEFTCVLVKEIERGWDTDLKSYLSTAQLHADETRMEKLIHESAS
ncbi:hypothetical protein [Pseudomonas mandelii]